MKQSKKLNHVPVFDARTGLKAGYMIGFQYGDLTRTEGLFFIDLEGQWRHLDADQVELMGEDAVFLIANAKTTILDKQPKKIRYSQKSVPILTSEGVSAGRVSDIMLQDQNIVGVEVSDGLIKDIVQGRGFLLYRDIAKWGKDLIMVQPNAIMYRQQLSLSSRLLRAFFLVFLFLLIIPLRILLKPILFSLLIAYGLYPAVSYMRKRGISYSISALAAFLILFLGITIFILVLTPMLNREIQEIILILPNIFTKFSDLIQKLPEQGEKWGIYTSPLRWQTMLDRWQELTLERLENFLSTLTGSIGQFFDFIISPFIAFYILKDWDNLKIKISSIFTMKIQGDLAYAGTEIHKVVKSFLKGNLLTSIIVGILTYFGLLFLGINFPGTLSLLAGLGNLIPYFGAIISTIPVILLGWLQSPWKALAATAFVIIIQQLESNVLTPRILSHSLGLSPLTIILALIVGGEFFGIFGMFLATPAAAIIHILGKRILTKLV